MRHPLVTQLRFARSEFVRCLEGITAADARRRFEPMNCISWMVGHLAMQEHQYWVVLAQNKEVAPALKTWVGYGLPATRPPLADMWAAWHQVTATADGYLDQLTSPLLLTYFEQQGKRRDESVGTMLLRNIYHYWFHIGEAHAVRQQLGHQDLPQFVGDMSQAVYQPEG